VTSADGTIIGSRQPLHGGLVTLRFDPELRMFLDSRHRGDQVEAGYDGTSSLGHLVESLGVPLTEVGELLIGEHMAAASQRVRPGQPVTVRQVGRPQEVPGGAPRFCLDVHLGALARRLRLLGQDTAYQNDAGDDELAAQARAEGRMLLTQDRGLLRRRAVALGAYVRGRDPDAQLYDVLDRFAPPLTPWTRCSACNGLLAPVPKHEIEHLLQPGTRRTYDAFARCGSCGRLYWRGAHARRLAPLVHNARLVVGARRQPGQLETAAG
jgi:uncharacterized protein with PIN domain